MRISTWVEQWGGEIVPCTLKPEQTGFRVRDAFTTRDGSWEPSDKPGSVPQWARDSYLKPLTSPYYNDDGGADHHLFGAILQTSGLLTPFASFDFWTHTDNRNHIVVKAKKHGWANQVIFSHFSPERGERGAWAWRPSGVPADVFIGGGMPNNLHVSWYVVWESVVGSGEVDPPDNPPDDGDLVGRVAALEREVRNLWTAVGQRYG